MGGTRPFTDASRVAALLEEWYAAGHTRRSIAQDTGVDERTQWRIINDCQVVGFDTLDKLLTGMEELSRVRGEFADVYAELLAPTTEAEPRSPSQVLVPSSRVRTTR